MQPRDLVHDRLDFPNGVDQEIEVWSDDAGKDSRVTLYVSAPHETHCLSLTPAEARVLSAMLARGADRIEALMRKAAEVAP